MATVGEIVRCTLKYTSPNASEGQSVFHWIIGGLGAEDIAIVNTVRIFTEDQWADHWSALADAQSVLQDMVVQIVNLDGTVERNLADEDIAISGTQPGGVAPAAASGLLAAPTSVPTAVGRKYVPYPSDDHIDGGAFDASAIANLVLLAFEWVQILSVAGGGNLTPGVIRRTAEAFEPFLNTANLETIPAYQRRRKPGVGI